MLVECVEHSAGLRRDGACQHAVLHQRPARAAALDEAAHVCLLMHVGAAQARTPGRQERQRVSPAAQVRAACCAHGGGGCWTRICADSGKHRGLGRVCGVMRWGAGLEYGARAHEPPGPPRQPHLAPQHTPPPNTPLIR